MRSLSKQIGVYGLCGKILIMLVAMSIFYCENEDAFDVNNKTNQSPTAKAGPDQLITLPTNSVFLDGTASSDSDGTIERWFWKKISSPNSFEIVSASSSKTEIKNLVVGIYEVELNITDNGGLSAKDTIQISVFDNNTPIANAGPDQAFTLPKNSTLLDGSASADQEGIIAYFWRKIEGPDTFSIIDPSSAKTIIENLVEGIYEFELKVTNSSGLIATDSVKVGVFQPTPPNPNPSPVTPSYCDNSTRLQVLAQLVPLGSLSKSRVDFAVATVANKILFAGGIWTTDCPECWGSSRVDIYDTVTDEWSTAELSEGRHGIATTTTGTKVFFAGGANGDGAFDTLFSTVDIYDASTGNWSVTNLSQPRAYMAATSIGEKMLFAGGEKDWDYQTSNIVDIYDLTANSWSASTLSQARAYISAVSVNNKVYFAGGHKEDRWYSDPSDRIDIYDKMNGSWSTASLSQPMGIPSGIVEDQDIYWASGCDVEIKNVNTWNSTTANLFSSGESFFNKPNAVVKDDKIIFFRISYNGTDKFDIYDTTTNSWSIGVLPQKVYNTSLITLNNEIYLTAQTSIGSNKLWRLEF